ncbi:MAG: hypothetical protein JEZ10_08525, partial [Verrucomicrobia bacterium]|nr:hypothetical protein [Verrucomicrobiota bacterium]
MSTNRNFSIVVTAMVLAAAFSGQAETRFNGTVDTDWHNAANWSAGVPTSTLQARLQSQKTADINSPAV